MSGRAQRRTGESGGHPALRRVVAAVAGAAVAQGTFAAMNARQDDQSQWNRTNHRGETVSLLAGPSVAVGGATGALLGGLGTRLGPTAFATGITVGGLGVYDDIVGAREDQRSSKGFKGHLGALREGQVTSGLVKILGIGSVGLLAGAAVSPRPVVRHPVDAVVNGGLVAGTANLFNLLDLRPGRAVKAGLLVGAPVLASAGGTSAAGAMGAATAMLPSDLAERTMLGDGGANALGALLGLGIAAGAGRVVRTATLATVVGLTLASEKVSFTQVIESTPGLREVDGLGRRPR